MKRYFFVLCDELGDEFDISVNAPSYESALARVEYDHPESSILLAATSNMYIEGMATYIVKDAAQ